MKLEGFLQVHISGYVDKMISLAYVRKEYLGLASLNWTRFSALFVHAGPLYFLLKVVFCFL